MIESTYLLRSGCVATLSYVVGIVHHSKRAGAKPSCVLEHGGCGGSPCKWTCWGGSSWKWWETGGSQPVWLECAALFEKKHELGKKKKEKKNMPCCKAMQEGTDEAGSTLL